MNQRSFVEALDRQRNFAQARPVRGAFGSSWKALYAHAVNNGRQRLPSLREPFARDSFRLTLRRAAEERCPSIRLQNHDLNFFAQLVEIQTPRTIVAGEVDHVPHPLDVDRRILAVVLQQRNRDAGNGRGLHVRKGALQYGQAAHSDDCFDLSGLNQRHDQRRAFRDQHGVTKTLGFGLQILNGAESALLAQQSEFIERSGAAIFDTQALGKQQQAPFERNRRQLFAPDFVVQQHADVVRVDRRHAGARDDLFRVDAQLVEHKRRSQRVAIALHVPRDYGLQAFALEPCLRNVLLRRRPACIGTARGSSIGISNQVSPA